MPSSNPQAFRAMCSTHCVAGRTALRSVCVAHLDARSLEGGGRVFFECDNEVVAVFVVHVGRDDAGEDLQRDERERAGVVRDVGLSSGLGCSWLAFTSWCSTCFA